MIHLKSTTAIMIVTIRKRNKEDKLGEDPNVIDQVDINDVKVIEMVDTCWAAKVISRRIGVFEISRRSSALTSRSGFSVTLKNHSSSLNSIMPKIRWKECDKPVLFIVIRAKHQALIGRKIAVALGIVTLHTGSIRAKKSKPNQIKNHLSRAEIVSKFPKLFSGNF